MMKTPPPAENGLRRFLFGIPVTSRLDAQKCTVAEAMIPEGKAALPDRVKNSAEHRKGQGAGSTKADFLRNRLHHNSRALSTITKLDMWNRNTEPGSSTANNFLFFPRGDFVWFNPHLGLTEAKLETRNMICSYGFDLLLLVAAPFGAEAGSEHKQ